MRPTSLLLSCALFMSASAGILLLPRQNPPACATPCFNTGTNGVPLGECASSDSVCQCRSPPYVQGVINCLATYCASHEDVLTSIQISTSFCGIQGVNDVIPGITTPLSQLAPSSTAPPASSSSAPAAASTTTSRSAAVGKAEPRMVLGAILFAAAGVAAAGV